MPEHSHSGTWRPTDVTESLTSPHASVYALSVQWYVRRQSVYATEGGSERCVAKHRGCDNWTADSSGCTVALRPKHTRSNSLNVAQSVFIACSTLRFLWSATDCGIRQHLVNTDVPLSPETGTSKSVHVLFVLLKTEEMIM